MFDDTDRKLIACKRSQTLEPFLSVATGKYLSDLFRESFVLELRWEKNIDFLIDDQRKVNHDNVRFITLVKKYFSKRIRQIFSK